MAIRRKVSAERELRAGETGTPTEEDEADILEEVAAEHDEESGGLVADREKVLGVGAFDAESVRENRRREKISKKKRGNVDGVSFNTGETLGTYDSILTCYPTSQVEIRVRRLTGSEVMRLITSGPRDAAELYNALMEIHGVYDEAKYEVIFVDSVSKKWFGKTKITLPNTRPQTQQGQPPMQHQYPPGYPPQYAPPQYSPQPPAPVQQQQHPSAPVVQFAPPPSVDPMALMQQTFDLFQRMQASMQPPPQPYQTAPAPMMMPPPPPQSSNPADQMAWMENAMRLFQQMQQAATFPAMQPAHAPQPPQQTQSGPPGPPPRGMRWIWVHPYGFALEAEQPAAPPERPVNPMFRGPRPGYDPHGDRPYQPQQPPQQQRPQTLADQLRESVASTRATVEAMQEISSLLPGYGGQQEAPEPVADDDSPVQVVNMGPARGVINKHDGSTRWGETIVANLPDIFKWVGEQHKMIQDKAERRQQQEHPPVRQLRPGEVEVMPGQQPPQGYTFVPVEQEEGLAPPPEHVPPPISTPRRTWEAPMIPEDRES